MKSHEMFRAIKADYRRYRATGANGFLEVVLFRQGFWATSVYRLTRIIHLRVKFPVVRHLLRFLSKIAIKLTEITTGISLPVGCDIGPGLLIGHFGHVIIHPRTKMGCNCNLSQGVNIGIAQRGKRSGVPILGDRVFVGPNAVILGNISIGDDAVIGAGAIVVHSVPPRAVVVGNPAQIISHNGSFEFIKYDGRDDDPERLASLKLKEALQN